MTRELLLELHNGVYCEKIQREREGSLEDYYRKALCASFVDLLVSGEPERVKVVLNDKGKSQEGFIEVRVTRMGHYRWSWGFADRELVKKNHVYGLYRVGEDILMSIFPNDFDEKDKDGKKAVVFLRDNGKAGIEEHSLWIKVTPL
jgi:hypothetical protein